MRTFQHNRPFAGMSVLENVLVGAHTRFRAGNLFSRQSARRRNSASARARGGADRVRRPGASCATPTSATLSFGQGRLLEIARALAGEPKLMLFDEPAAGLTPAELERVAGVIRGIAARGIAVLLIEHDMHFLLPLAHRVVVLNFGAQDRRRRCPTRSARDPAVMEAYLGGHAAAR